MNYPSMQTVRQQFNIPSIPDPAGEARRILNESGVLNQLKPGGTVAVGVGSRGIVELCTIVKAVCQCLKEAGTAPFLFPAMGSHGGATSEGQKEVLHSLGISQESTGVEIRSEATGVLMGETKDGIPLYADKNAIAADHIVMINRIKPHTKFKGAVESGITKMLTVGMGKVQGAGSMHRHAISFGFPHVIMTSAQKIMEFLPFRFGLGIIETPDKKVHSLTVLRRESLMEQEEELLKQASEIMPRIPIQSSDLLIVDEIGKDISGTGMDTNVIGRNRDILGDFNIPPNPLRIFVRNLTERTHGNANGIGFADFTTRRLVDQIDFPMTYKNSLTAMSPEKAAIPMTLDSDREAIAAALESIGYTDGSEAKIIRIKNTSELSTFQISNALADTLEAGTSLETTGQPEPMNFDSQGNLKAF